MAFHLPPPLSVDHYHRVIVCGICEEVVGADRTSFINHFKRLAHQHSTDNVWNPKDPSVGANLFDAYKTTITALTPLRLLEHNDKGIPVYLANARRSPVQYEVPFIPRLKRFDGHACRIDTNGNGWICGASFRSNREAYDHIRERHNTYPGHHRFREPADCIIQTYSARLKRAKAYFPVYLPPPPLTHWQLILNHEPTRDVLDHDMQARFNRRRHPLPNAPMPHRRLQPAYRRHYQATPHAPTRPYAQVAPCSYRP